MQTEEPSLMSDKNILTNNPNCTKACMIKSIENKSKDVTWFNLKILDTVKIDLLI